MARGLAFRRMRAALLALSLAIPAVLDAQPSPSPVETTTTDQVPYYVEAGATWTNPLSISEWPYRSWGATLDATFGGHLLGVAAPGVSARFNTSARSVYSDPTGGVFLPSGTARLRGTSMQASLARVFALSSGLNFAGRLRGGAFAAFASVDPQGGFVDEAPEFAQDSGIGVAVGADLSLGVALWPGIDLTLGAQYDRYIGYNDYFSISAGIRSYAGTSARRYHSNDRVGVFETITGAPAGQYVELENAALSPIFPVLGDYYAENPIGSIEAVNTSAYDLQNVRLSVSIPGFSVAPSIIWEEALLPSQSRLEVPLLVDLDDRVLQVTEARQLSAEVTIDFAVVGFSERRRFELPMTVVDRNAVQWVDDRRVASFMSPRDELLRVVSNRAVGIVRDDMRPGLDHNLQKAIAVYQALTSLDLTYVIDPASSYEALSQDEAAIDFVQFPRQTIYYRGGDCDDLTVALNTLLESVDVPTGFITTPGHIFSAFRLELDYDEAVSSFTDPGRVLQGPDSFAWVPIEATVLDRGFAVAWAIGAQQLNYYDELGQAQFFATREAWETYAPSQSVGTEAADFLNDGVVRDSFVAELDRLVGSQLAALEAPYRSRLARNASDTAAANALGVLYAQYGEAEEAIRILSAIAEPRPDAVVQTNLANALLLAGDTVDAIEIYRLTVNSEPEAYPAWIGLSLGLSLLGEYDEGREAYRTGASINPNLADRYEFLAEVSAERRAALANGSIPVVWARGPE